MIPNKPDPVTSFLTLLIVGLVAAYFAKKKGKNPALWFMIGFIFSLPGLCFLLFFPSLKEYFKKKQVPIEKKETPPPAFTFSLETIWYYLDQNNIQKGPMSFQLLQKMQKEGEIQTNTYVWNESLVGWKKWEELFPRSDV